MGYKYATITGARTTLKNRNTRNNANTICTRDFLETDFEVLSLNLNWDNTSAYSFLLSISNATAMFHDSKKLKKIEDRLNVGSCNAASLQLMFANCKALRDVKVERLNADLSFSDCKYLTNASILYAIQYALTGAIKITLHADAYARATADSAITAALATKTNVTLVSA